MTTASHSCLGSAHACMSTRVQMYITSLSMSASALLVAKIGRHFVAKTAQVILSSDKPSPSYLSGMSCR